MAKIEFSNEQKEQIVDNVQRYFEQNLEHDIAQFDAEFLVGFFSKLIGSFYYNKVLYDAQAAITSKVDTISDAIYELEQATETQRLQFYIKWI